MVIALKGGDRHFHALEFTEFRHPSCASRGRSSSHHGDSRTETQKHTQASRSSAVFCITANGVKAGESQMITLA